MTNKELQSIYYGAYSFQEREDGWLQAFQYSKRQMDYFEACIAKGLDFWYDRCMATSAKTLETRTDAGTISFEYRIIWTGSQDSFELAVNGQITEIRYVKDLPEEGKLMWQGTWKPVPKNEKVLWLGDSITQGYGPLRSAMTYVSVANRQLNYDLINQGIGGYVYDQNSLMKMDGYTPDKIIVALGTNQFGCESMKDVEAYYETLTGIYGNRIPILCITPLWRGDVPDGLPVLTRFCRNVAEIAGRYSNVKVIDGFRLVPHLPEYFLDNLHPNALGAEEYGRNLTEEIRRIGF